MPAVVNAQLDLGRAWPLGALWDGHGVNFAVFAAHATAVELCLFDADGGDEQARLALPGRSDDVWHGYLPGAAPGLLYGLRAHGPWQPERGQRHNPHKLLLDPYAREIAGTFEWRAEHFAHDTSSPLTMDTRDNAPFALKARVLHDDVDWGDDRRPLTPLADSVLYELHVKGYTRRHPAVPEPLRGSYAGLASDAGIAHLRRLGITAVSLLPVQQRLDEQRLVGMGLSNHWGYNTIGLFAVEPRLASGAGGLSPRDEFRAMVRRLHAAGIEVIVDVVFNHTAESDETGPSLCWRGLDNASYYRLRTGAPSLYENPSGCGNALDLRQPRVLQMVMDCLRYWVQALHVDGFRFDLAPVLAREDAGAFDANAAFFRAVAQDPLLAGVKLIAEPWDVGPGGYQLGRFPRGWLEWNDRFRDATRAFWLGHPATRGEFAQRLAASSDLFRSRSRPPAASVNFVVAHDGFTLRDLVSYERRHNEANGEHNRDGHGHNLSTNCGAEGETGDGGDAAIDALRARLQRALLASLLLAQGTPMLCAGAELGHSQGGNNNAYCQDNATSWIDWSRADESLLDFSARLLALRKRLLPLGAHWYGGATDAHGLPDLEWLRADGKPLDEADWRDTTDRVLGAFIGAPGRAGAALLLLVNAETQERRFALPPGRWQLLIDSGEVQPANEGVPIEAPHYGLRARSLALLGAVTP